MEPHWKKVISGPEASGKATEESAVVPDDDLESSHFNRNMFTSFYKIIIKINQKVIMERINNFNFNLSVSSLSVKS